jgi:hypothetical protein
VTDLPKTRLPKGTKSINIPGPWHDDTEWETVACSYHAGDAVVRMEEREDPDTGKPRFGTFWSEQDMAYVDRVIEFPVYSRDELDKVGHDPDCLGCQRAVFETHQHADASRVSAQQALFDLEQQLRARNIPESMIERVLRGWIAN